MKLLQIVESAAGGVGKHVIDLCEGLLARKHEVHLVYSDLRLDQAFAAALKRLSAHATFHACPIPIPRSPSIRDLAARRAISAYYGNHGPFDLTHNHSTKAGLIGRMASPRGAKRAYSAHGFFTMDPNRPAWIRFLWSRMEAALSLLDDSVIAVSIEEAAHAESIGISSAKIRVIPNGVAMIRPARSRAEVRERWGLAEDDVCIGFVGRLVPVKSPETMLRAFAELVTKTRLEPALVMIGDGPLARTLRDMSADLQVDRYIRWLGECDAKEVMHAFDVLALTSDSEAHSIAVLEGIASGLPIVATSVGGISGMVQQGVNGFVTPVRGVREIADALSALVTDALLRERMGRASLEISKRFSLDRMVDQTVALYEEVVSGVASEPASPRKQVAAAS